MTSFFAVENYNPFLVLLTGLSTFVGLWGLGTILLLWTNFHLPVPWNHVTATLLGIQTLSLFIQIIGMAHFASRDILIGIWWTVTLVGAVTLILSARIRFDTISLETILFKGNKCELLPSAIVVIAIGVNLIVAMAPSTKIDELYYHMLVPSRVVSDAALRFYLEPWQAAILPHMVFQISAAPVHAIGYPDAANVVSWAISALLIWFAWFIIHSNAKPIAWASFWSASLCVGIYSVVWQVTGGAHAMGDLALAAAIVAFCERGGLLKELAPPFYAAMLSVLLLSAASSKISLLPLSIVILSATVWRLFKFEVTKFSWRIAMAIAVPWIIFFCPIAIWTWAQSGSPFGPVLAEKLGASIYPVGWASEVFRDSRAEGQGHLIRLLEHTIVSYSPLVWIGVIASFVRTNLFFGTRILLGVFLALQFTLVYWLLPYDARYFGGLHFGLLIAFACSAKDDIQRWLSVCRNMATACVVLLLPWLALQAYYAKQFFRVSIGIEKIAFYERYVSFYDDYVRLDQVLPKNAIILVSDFRLSSVYMPRPVFFGSADLPHGKPVVWFASPETINSAGQKFAGYKVGNIVYQTSEAVIETYRTPGRPPLIGALEVVNLVDEE